MESAAIPKVTKVLIVEDEPAQMQLTRRALESHGTFHLTTAQNAQEAFQRLNEEVPLHRLEACATIFCPIVRVWD